MEQKIIVEELRNAVAIQDDLNKLALEGWRFQLASPISLTRGNSYESSIYHILLMKTDSQFSYRCNYLKPTSYVPDDKNTAVFNQNLNKQNAEDYQLVAILQNEQINVHSDCTIEGGSYIYYFLFEKEEHK